MCIVSMVYDQYDKWWQETYPKIWTTGTATWLSLTDEQIADIKKIIAQFYEDKKKAEELDNSLGQPDCVDSEKQNVETKMRDIQATLNKVPELNRLRDEALRIATEKGFTDASPAEDIALMHSELSEVLEDIRFGYELNKTRYDIIGGGGFGKPCGVPSELADVIIRVLHFCGKHNIDIDKAVREKMAYNSTRPFKHGGKKL